MKNYSTKRALIASILMLALCCSMLLGTTYAWFTDSVTSSNNVIKTGKLEIGFDKWDETANSGAGAWVSAEGAPIFNYTNWEPGYTEIVNLRVTNLGTLALKWQAVITTENSLSALADVINVYVKSDDQADTVKDYIAGVDRFGFEAEAEAGNFKKFTLRDFVENLTVMTNGVLVEDQESYLGVVLQMDTNAGNEYQNMDLGGKFDLTILATQYTYEDDSFDETYDEKAPFEGSTIAPIPDGAAFVEVPILDQNNQKVGTVLATSASFVDGAKQTVVNIIRTATNENITVGAGYTKETYNITVSNIKDDNTAPIKVQLYIGKDLDGDTVKVYHYDTLIDSTYVPSSGYVIFETTDFSPFTFVYDANSEHEYPSVDDTHPGAPTALVVTMPQYVNVPIKWGSSMITPDYSVDPEPKLEAAYKFACNETLDQVAESEYKDWYCDFYVKLDKDLGANQIFLGGNYGTFGWLGFHNGDITLEANQEIPLLGSVTENPWTYEMIANLVGEFICGVGDVNDQLVGATFTVILRLTNPEDESDIIDVATVDYKFTETVMAETQASLNEAIANGATTVVLGEGNYTVPAAVAGKDVTIVGSGDSTVFDFTKVNNVSGANVTFSNLKITGVNSNTMNGYGIQSTTGKVIYNNCTFENAVTNEFFGDVYYYNCNFIGTFYVTTYAVKSATFEGCTFDRTDSRALLVYSHGNNPLTVNVKDCTFKAAAKGYTWVPEWTAAVEVDTTNITSAGTTVTIENCTYDENYNGIVRDKSTAGKETSVITVDGVVVDNTTIKTTGYSVNG